MVRRGVKGVMFFFHNVFTCQRLLKYAGKVVCGTSALVSAEALTTVFLCYLSNFKALFLGLFVFGQVELAEYLESVYFNFNTPEVSSSKTEVGKSSDFFGLGFLICLVLFL